MNSRMDKYYKKQLSEETRTEKNKEIYDKNLDQNFDKLSLTSNISIIDTDTTNLDINKLKSLLDEKYKENRRKSSSLIEEEEIEEKLDDTKEYDLNKIIENAHKNKENDYDSERFKKLRDTQYDILKSLDLDRNEDPQIEESLTVEEANLMNLIKTVNDNSLKKEQIIENNSDLMSDLMGDSNTEVLDAMPIEETDTEPHASLLEELEKTKQFSKKEIVDEINKEEKLLESTEVLDKIEEETEYEEENTFYTGKLQIKDSDMNDFEDLQKEMKSGNNFIKILIFVFVLIIIFALIYFLNKYFNLGLF